MDTHATLDLPRSPGGQLPPQPRVVALVLNWNGERDTIECVDSLLAQRGVALEVAIIDNASADGSGARLHARYPALPYLATEENLGYAGGNNVGLSWAMDRGADWILVINNDTVAEPDCVARLLAAATSDASIAALAPLIVRHDDPARVWFAGGSFSRVRALGTHDGEGALTSDVASAAHCAQGWCECTFLTGCCLLLRADALRAAGTFRAEYFAYVEDVELSVRLRAAGWRLGWVPGARLAHRVPPFGAPPSPFQITMRDRNRRRMVREHYGWKERAAFELWFWPTRLVHFLRYVVKGDLPRARALLAALRTP